MCGCQGLVFATMARFTAQRNVTEYSHGQCNISLVWGYLQCIEKAIIVWWHLLKTCASGHFTLPFLCSRLFSFHCRACALWPLFGQVGDISVLPTPLPGLYVQGKSVRQMRLPNLLFTHIETLLGVEEFEQLSES